MAYDPTVLSQIYKGAPNITGAMQDAYTLKNVIDTEQLNQMKLNEARQEQSDTQTLKGILGKYDLSNPEQQSKAFAEAVKVNPAMGMKLQREFSQMQAGQAEKESAQLGLWKQKHEIIDSAITPIYQYGQQLLEQWKQANPQAQLPPGQFPPEINAKLLPLVQQTAMQLKGQNLSSGQPVLNQEDLAQVQSLISGQDTMAGLTRLVQSSSTAREQLAKLEQGAREARREKAQDTIETTIRGQDGKPHRVLVDKVTKEIVKDIGIAETPEKPPVIGGTRGKPPAGYMWDPEHENELTFIPGGPKDPTKSPISGREGVMFSRVASSANEAVAAIKNIVELPIGASSGILGVGGSAGHSLISSTKSALTNEIANQEVQDYNSMLAGVKRNLATIETAGLAPSGALTEGFASLELRPGDTNLTKMRKLAEMRQVVEKGLEVNLDNPRLPEEQKTLVKRIIQDVQTAVPFTQHDVTEYQKSLRTNKNETLTDYMQRVKPKAATQPTSSSDRRVPPAETPSRSGDGAGPATTATHRYNPATNQIEPVQQ